MIGLKSGYISEKNFKYYTVIAIVFFILNVLLESNTVEFCLLFITASGVFSAEYVNTAIEKLCDIVNAEFNDKIKIIKDIAAAAVLAFGIGFFAVQGAILLPKIL